LKHILLGAVLALFFVASYSTAVQILPKISDIKRANTVTFVKAEFASDSILERANELLQSRHPNEGAVCFYGFARDTIVAFNPINNPDTTQFFNGHVAVIDSVAEANIEQSNGSSISFVGNDACSSNPRLIGVSHSHPLAVWPVACTHSDGDALYVHNSGTKYWFSVVVCPQRTEVMWADGRRWNFLDQNEPAATLDTEKK